ncbi:MAG: hypothetical protein E5299_01621 [Burkholderia gladioli]|nr:MAG: hypothetical protein E5299_01621 [Burkholderia gladioli]
MMSAMRLITPTHPETVAGEHIEPIHHSLGKRSPVVATAFLPFARTLTGNYINRAVTPRYTGCIRWPMSDALTWRNRRNCTACSSGRMAWLGVVGTGSTDHDDLFVARNLVEKLLIRNSGSGNLKIVPHVSSSMPLI